MQKSYTTPHSQRVWENTVSQSSATLATSCPISSHRHSSISSDGHEESADGRESFRGYEESTQCQGVAILDLAIEGLQSNDVNNIRIMRLENEDMARLLATSVAGKTHKPRQYLEGDHCRAVNSPSPLTDGRSNYCVI